MKASRRDSYNECKLEKLDAYMEKTEIKNGEVFQMKLLTCLLDGVEQVAVLVENDVVPVRELGLFLPHHE